MVASDHTPARPLMELGLYTFAEVGTDPSTGKPVTAEERFRRLLEEIELAEQVGLDVFGIGEHHRPDFAVSAPAIALAAAAARTTKIRLTSAVTVLSSEDPVRVFQQYATIDLLSQGRAEIMVGRGSFTESFPLFGQDLKDYDELFAEKLLLLLEVRRSERVTWSGKHRPALRDQPVYPRPVQDPLPVWVAVGGNPESAARAGLLGLPVALAIIGGQPERFAPFATIHREAARRAGHSALPFSINSHGFIADTAEAAMDIAFPAFSDTMNRIGRERGWQPMRRPDYEASATLHGASFIGGPDEVIEKILFQHRIFGHQRFLMQMSVGTVPHDQLLRSIELFGTKVAPAVRKELGVRPPRSAGPLPRPLDLRSRMR